MTTVPVSRTRTVRTVAALRRSALVTTQPLPQATEVMIGGSKKRVPPVAAEYPTPPLADAAAVAAEAAEGSAMASRPAAAIEAAAVRDMGTARFTR